MILFTSVKQRFVCISDHMLMSIVESGFVECSTAVSAGRLKQQNERYSEWRATKTTRQTSLGQRAYLLGVCNKIGRTDGEQQRFLFSWQGRRRVNVRTTSATTTTTTPMLQVEGVVGKQRDAVDGGAAVEGWWRIGETTGDCSKNDNWALATNVSFVATTTAS